MNTINAKKRGARTKISSSKLLSTSALTAAGLIAFSAIPAKADDVHSWDNLAAQKGNFLTDTSIEDVTNITLTTSSATAIGNADIYKDDTVNVDGRLFIVKDNKADPTRILGKLNSNGRIVVIDANGVFFGNNSRVDVAGIVATTGELNEDKLDAGNIEIALSDSGGSVEILEGAQISVGSAGLAAFVAPTVVNNGIINAKMGNVVMAAGEKVTLDMYGDGLLEVAVDGKLGDALLENKGTINAQGGTVQITAKAAKQAIDNIINVSGVVDVSSATQKGGKIILSGGDSGKVAVSGKLDAKGKTGGDIEVTGQFVSVKGSALLDASGDNGGGTIHFGGDWQGQGEAPTSEYAFVAQDAILRADAGENGDGGEVVVWSDKVTGFFGLISARGGANGGDGGMVETSSKGILQAFGSVDASAANGIGGEWLLDPRNLEITNSTDDGYTSGGSPNIITAVDPGGAGNTSHVSNDTIEASLNAGTSVTLRTSDADNGDGDINVNAAINKTGNNNATLRMEAHDDINVNSDIGATGNGRLNLVLLAGFFENGNPDAGNNDVNIGNNVDINTNGGDLEIGADRDITGSGSSSVLTEGGRVVMVAGGSTHLGIANHTIIGAQANSNILFDGDIDTDGGQVLMNAGDDIRIGGEIKTDGGAATFVAEGANNSGGDILADVEFKSGGSLNTTRNGSDGNVFIKSENFINGGFIVATDAAVNIGRSTIGTIDVGDNNGSSFNISQNELYRVISAGLVIGDDANTTNVTVDNVDMFSQFTSANDQLPAPSQGCENSSGNNPNCVQNFEMKDTNLTLKATQLVDIVGPLTMGTGWVTVDAPELDLDARINGKSTLNGLATPLNDARLIGTQQLDQIDVLSNDALIQQAIWFADSTAQKLINVAQDTYTENLLINKNDLKLDGANATLRYENANSGSGIVGNLVTVTADNVNIDPFVFDGLGIANYGINATGADNLIVDGNTFQNFLLTNVNVTDSSGVRIFGNTMTGAQKGVYANNTPDIWVYSNTINNATVAGVHVANTNGTDYFSDIDIWNNDINNAASANGIVVENSNFATIGAHLTNQPDPDDVNNGNNITGGINGVVIVNSSDAMVRHNTISGTSVDGVEVNGGTRVNVLDNTISNIGWDGIQFNASTNGQIKNNSITNVTGASGIAVMGGSHDTVIDDNDIDGVDRLGIYVWNTNGLEITGNDINNTGREGGNNWFLSGIHLENSSNSTIQGNLIRNTGGDAIHVGGTGNAPAVTTTGNSILDNVIGYTSMSAAASAGDDNVKGDGIEIADSDNAFIQGNKIIDASRNGIYNNNSDNTVIGGLGALGNIITSVDLSGVLVNPSFNVDVIGNIITTANEGVKLVGNTDIDVLYNMISDINTDGIQISSHNGVLNITGNLIGADDHGIYHDDNITAGDNIDIHDNIINANQDNGAIGSGIFFNGTVSGGTIDIGNGDNYYNEGNPSNIITVADNTLNANDDNLDGIHFNKDVSGGVINIDGNRIGMTGTPNAAGSESNFYSLTDDGIEFRGAVNGNADVNISDNTITSIDDGIRFNGAVGGNATITVGDGGAYSNDIQGNSGHGIVFESTISGQAQLDIVNNIQIRGGLDGIAFEGETSNFLTPPGASQQEINISGNNGVGNLGGILGGNNGIRFAQNADTDLHDIRIAGNRIIGNSQHGIAFNGDIGGDETQIWINDNSYVRGNLDGIHFDEEVIGEATIEIADNAWIEGVHDDAIDFSDRIVGGATVRINGNDNIVATNVSGTDADNGIEFDAVSDATIEIIGNNHGIHANDHGIFFGGDISGGSEINVHDNIISANENGGIGDGIHFAGTITNSDVFIGDGLSAAYFVNTSNIIRGNDGIHFAGSINGNSDIVIDGNHLGYYRDALGNEFASELNDDGIEFAGHINGNSEIMITDNRINADDDGIRFGGEIRDNAEILVGGFSNGNVILADEDGIQFADDIEDNSEVTITWNDIESDDNGIVFNGTTRNTGDFGNEDILIAYNDIESDANGVVFTGRAEGAFHDIMVRDNFQIHGHGGHGIAHTGGVDDAELRIQDNDDIYGDTDGIHVSGLLFNGALVDIDGNTVEGTNNGDGIEVTDTGFLGGVDVNITDNHIHFVGDNGIEVNNVPDVFIGFNDIHNVDGNGIYVSNSENAQIRWNDIWSTDEDGIFIIGSHGSNIEDNNLWFIGDDGIDVRNSHGAEIEDNFIWIVRGDGIQVRGSSLVNIDDNVIRFAGDDGIDFEGGFFSSINGNDIRFVGANGIEIEDSAFIVADSNTVQNAGDAGIFVDPSAFILISNNTLRFNEYGVRFDEVYLSAIYDNVIEDNRIAGVRLNDSHGIAVWRNDIVNNGRYGLWVDGGLNGYINVAGNNFLDNPTHARFESGIIDLRWVDPLLGYGNTFVGGDVGLEFDVWNNDTPRLSLVRAGGGYTYDGNPFDTFNGVNVAGNPALNFGGTIGQQYFEGQSQYFVAVRSDTFVDRAGNAVWLDASDSTYFMPGEGLITGDVLTQAQFDFLEEKFRHWPDVNNRGIFWFGAVPDETTLSILKDPIYTPYDAGVSGLNVTITGLPRISGGAPIGSPGISGLNQIAPAAGDEAGGTQQADVEDIEPAAGGNDQPVSQSASCWGDAVNAAGAGSTVTYSYGGTFEESVAAAASCNTASLF